MKRFSLDFMFEMSTDEFYEGLRYPPFCRHKSNMVF